MLIIINFFLSRFLVCVCTILHSSIHPSILERISRLDENQLTKTSMPRWDGTRRWRYGGRLTYFPPVFFFLYFFILFSSHFFSFRFIVSLLDILIIYVTAALECFGATGRNLLAVFAFHSSWSWTTDDDDDEDDDEEMAWYQRRTNKWVQK